MSESQSDPLPAYCGRVLLIWQVGRLTLYRQFLSLALARQICGIVARVVIAPSHYAVRVRVLSVHFISLGKPKPLPLTESFFHTSIQRRISCSHQHEQHPKTTKRLLRETRLAFAVCQPVLRNLEQSDNISNTSAHWRGITTIVHQTLYQQDKNAIVQWIMQIDHILPFKIKGERL